MKITESNSYGTRSVEQAYVLVASQAFREQACVEQGASEYEVTIEANAAGGDTVTLVRTMPAELPDYAKKFIGDTVKVKQVEQWSAADSAGRRNAEVRVTIIGQPVDVTGTAVISAEAGQATMVFNGDVKVSVPFLGKKIEPEVARAISASLRHDAELAATQAG